MYNHVIENNIVVLNDGTGTRLNPINMETSSIDLSLVNTSIGPHCTWYVDQKSTHGSDHFVVNIKISYKPMIYSNQYNSLKWNYKNADWKGFTNACDIKFSCNMVSDNIQETNTTLTKELINIAGDYIPVKKFNNKNQKPCVPWWDQNCTKLVRQRNNARNRASHTGRGEDFKNYKEKEKLCKKLLHDTQQTNWENYCNSLNNNSNLSQVWYNVIKMLGHAPSKKEIPTLKQNDVPYESSTDKSNLFAENFSKVSSTDNYSSQFKIHKQQVENNDHNNITDHFNNNSNCYNDTFTLQEMQDAIADTNNSAPGKDRLSYNMFKHLSEKTLSIFLLFINKIWFLQEIPKDWKHSIIIPIHKTGKNPSDPLSYRPISLTSNLNKIMEKMVNNRLQWYLEKHKLYNPNQSGFRKNRNTMEQCIRLENDIQKSFVNKYITVGVFIDFQKAFDMLWKHGLLQKMVSLNIYGNMLSYVNGYLSNRTLQVRINNTCSDTYIVQNGTPPGSCISPTLFNIMVNDLPSCIKNCEMSQFADDGAIWKSGPNLKHLQNKIQQDLDNINKWCSTWGFLLSPNKTVGIIFSRKQKLGKLVLKIGTHILEIVKEVKFLGIIFDCRLTWLNHIQYIHTKCIKILNCMRLLTGTKWGANSYTL